MNARDANIRARLGTQGEEIAKQCSSPSRRQSGGDGPLPRRIFKGATAIMNVTPNGEDMVCWIV